MGKGKGGRGGEEGRGLRERRERGGEGTEWGSTYRLSTPTDKILAPALVHESPELISFGIRQIMGPVSFLVSPLTLLPHVYEMG